MWLLRLGVWQVLCVGFWVCVLPGTSPLCGWAIDFLVCVGLVGLGGAFGFLLVMCGLCVLRWVFVVGFGFHRWLVVLLVLSVRFVAWVDGCVMLDFDDVV